MGAETHVIRRKPWLIFAGAIAALLAYNGWVTLPVSRALDGENKLTAVMYRSWLIDPQTVVFDIWNIGPEAAMVDVDRELFKAAEALKDRHYKSVVLAFRGRGRFRLDGDQFKTIGEERSTQNPIYTVRTLTEYISRMDGTPAFATWSGGWLGVLNKEMEQHQELHYRWYLLALTGQDPDGPLPASAQSDAP